MKVHSNVSFLLSNKMAKMLEGNAIQIDGFKKSGLTSYY
jgi:hypothetical protein